MAARRRGDETGRAMTFTIAHITDPHLSPAPPPFGANFRLKRFMGYVNWKRSREALNDMALLARIVADLRDQRPDHVAMTGDVVNIGWPAEFDRAAVWMKTLGDPRERELHPWQSRRLCARCDGRARSRLCALDVRRFARASSAFPTCACAAKSR